MMNNKNAIGSKIKAEIVTVELLSDTADQQHSNNDSNSSSTMARPSCYKSSILPKRMYTVVGLESSGTTFTTEVIKKGLNIRSRREGHKVYEREREESEESESESEQGTKTKTIIDFDMEQEDIQVQHFSLPWGSSCKGTNATHIVDVVLPTQCTRDHGAHEQHDDDEEVQRCCNAMADELFDIRPNGKAVKYPPRYNLDVVSHKEWYEKYGVDQWIVIVLRDPDISIAARSKRHCTDTNRLLSEEQIGKDIIIDVINKYILGKDEKKVTRETYKFWYAKNFQDQNMEGIRGRGGHQAQRRLQEASTMPPALTSKNRVVLVSYESMMGLGQVYIKMLYDTLEIETDFIPEVKNGNSKYVG
uniref:Uncharacterized protein n=1 Tax=Chaetoceros debilis TaxID=122233 RepID=A0A7S3QFV7_9STRA